MHALAVPPSPAAVEKKAARVKRCYGLERVERRGDIVKRGQRRQSGEGGVGEDWEESEKRVNRFGELCVEGDVLQRVCDGVVGRENTTVHAVGRNRDVFWQFDG